MMGKQVLRCYLGTASYLPFCNAQITPYNIPKNRPADFIFGNKYLVDSPALLDGDLLDYVIVTD